MVLNKMKLYIPLFFLCLTSFLSAQEINYIVFFTDKKSSPYSTDNPSAFLSQRSVQRRINQHIAIDQSDLPVNPNYIQQVVSSGAQLINRLKWLNAITIKVKNDSIIRVIQQLPFVVNVEKIIPVKKQLPEEYQQKNNPNSETLKSTLQLSNDVYDYGNSLAQVAQIGGNCLHNLGFDGKNFVIAVLDAGFMNVNTLSCFDSIRLSNRILGTWDFVANETSVYEDNSHGTMVLSCMAANWPGNLVGTAPQSSYWLIRTENASSELIIEEDNWVAGAEFADSVGADIINSSLGYTTFDSTLQNHSWADLDGNTAIATIAADIAASKGIIICNSAGNEGAGSWKYISVPADADSILTIGAVDANGIRAGFSSVGPTADDRIKPDVAANGNGTFLIAPWNGNVTQSGGTSFSSPLIAGMCASLWQANPNKSNMEIISSIRAAGNQANNPDTFLGWGIPNFCTANGILGGTEIITAKNNDEILNVFYNPSESYFGIYYYSTQKNPLEFSISDLNGKVLLTETREVSENTIHFYKISSTIDLAAGIYLISAGNSEKKLTKKIMKF
jgi:serine protease AprX